MEKLYKIVNDGASVEEATSSIVTDTIHIDNPSLAVYHKFGYWPKEDVEPEKPSEEEGYVVYDDGYKYIDDGNGGKIIKRIYRKLLIVDGGMPEVGPNQEFVRDYWRETDSERIHTYVVVDVIDVKPTIDESTQIIVSDQWVVDEEALTKTHYYHVCTKVDNPPELKEGQKVVEDHWEVNGDLYTHLYTVRFVKDDPPTLEPDQKVVEDHWDDDGVTYTHIYDKIMFVVDNKPELKEGQQIVNSWFEDNVDTNTRTYFYEVRYVVDNPPVLEPGQEIVDERWEDDGTTKTCVYTVRFIVDNPPELSENQFIYEDHWEDDGTTRTHVYDVWTMVDVAPDPVEGKRICSTDRWEDDAENKQRKRVYIVKTIVDETPASDPDGNFWWEKDGEEETETQIIVKYKKVYRVWRVFSKLKLEMLIFQKGKLVAFDKFLNDKTMTNEAGETASLRRFYDQANELAENHKLFKPYLIAALDALKMTADEGEAILAQCVQRTFMIQD